MVCARFRDQNGDDTGIIPAVIGRNLRILHSILESDYKTATEYVSIPWNSTFPTNSIDEVNFNTLRRDYEACMDIDTIAKEGTKPLVSLVTELNSIFPLVVGDVSTTISEKDYDSFSKAIYYLEELGISTLATITVQNNYFTAKAKSVMIQQTTAVYSKNLTVYASQEGLKFYADDVAQTLLGVLPGNITEQEAAAIGEGVAQFESAIGTAMGTTEPGFVNSTIDGLAEIFPAMRLDRVVSSLAPANYPTSSTVVLAGGTFFANLSSLVVTYPKTVVQSYLIYKAAKQFDEFVVTDSSGISPSKRWQKCIAYVGETQKWTLGRFFASSSYSDSTLQFADKMTTNLRNQFKERIATLDWMSTESKARATKKLENMVQNIGYPIKSPNTKDPSSLADYYKGLNITSSWFANAVSARRHQTATTFSGLTKPIDRTNMDHSKVWDGNAAYHPLDNSINMLAGIQQLPFFSEELPGYATFGGLGSVVGHEILHGFDSKGRGWTENGQMGNLLDNATITAFDKKSQCFVDQYSKYEYDLPGGEKGKTDGALTLAENLSDAGGLRIAYDAWKKTQATSKDQSLPGLEGFTHDQLFFMFYANFYCNSPTPETNLEDRPTDDHAANAQRIIGGAANSRAFREAFKCKVKEPECELF